MKHFVPNGNQCECDVVVNFEFINGDAVNLLYRKFESTSNRCCHVAIDFTDFTVHTARCVLKAGESITRMQRRRHRMVARASLAR